MATTKLKPRYNVNGQTGVGFETPEGGFFVKTLFDCSARERARQEFNSGRPVVSAAIYESGKLIGYYDDRDAREDNERIAAVSREREAV